MAVGYTVGYCRRGGAQEADTSIAMDPPAPCRHFRFRLLLSPTYCEGGAQASDTSIYAGEVAGSNPVHPWVVAQRSRALKPIPFLLALHSFFRHANVPTARIVHLVRRLAPERRMRVRLPFRARMPT